MLVVGENGAGKTNLLEALHVGTQGFSPRTRTDAQLIRFGEGGALVSLQVELGGVSHRVRVRTAAGTAKTAELDGARLPSPESLRRTFSAIVFTPDRLAVVKGAPGNAPRVLRPRPRPAPAGPGEPSAGLRRGPRPAQRRAQARAARPLEP